MKILYILLLPILFGCSNSPRDHMLDEIWESRLIEQELAMAHLDQCSHYLNKEDFDAFYDEFHDYVKHSYTSQVLWDIWIKEVTK